MKSQILSGLDLMDHPALNQQLSLFRDEMQDDLADTAKLAANQESDLSAALRKVRED